MAQLSKLKFLDTGLGTEWTQSGHRPIFTGLCPKQLKVIFRIWRALEDSNL